MGLALHQSFGIMFSTLFYNLYVIKLVFSALFCFLFFSIILYAFRWLIENCLYERQLFESRVKSNQRQLFESRVKSNKRLVSQLFESRVKSNERLLRIKGKNTETKNMSLQFKSIFTLASGHSCLESCA